MKLGIGKQAVDYKKTLALGDPLEQLNSWEWLQRRHVCQCSLSHEISFMLYYLSLKWPP